MSQRELNELHERPALATTACISVFVVGHVSSRPSVITPLWQVPPCPLHTLLQLAPPEVETFHRTSMAGGEGDGAGGLSLVVPSGRSPQSSQSVPM